MSGLQIAVGSRSVERIVSVPMLDEAASTINAAHIPEEVPVPDARIALVPGQADAPARELKAAPSLDLKLQRADAFFASPDPEDGEGVLHADEPVAPRKPDIDARSSDDAVPADQAPSWGRRVPRFGAYAVGVAGLCGLAWAAGAHQFPGRPPVHTADAEPGLQRGQQNDELVAAVRRMGERLRALEARVDAKADAKADTKVDAEDAARRAPSGPAQPTTGKDIADLSARLDDMDARLTAKLSRIDAQLASVEQRAPAPRATEVARAQPPRHHAKHVHDAFDPTRDPSAPGAPRPLRSW